VGFSNHRGSRLANLTDGKGKKELSQTGKSEPFVFSKRNKKRSGSLAEKGRLFTLEGLALRLGESERANTKREKRFHGLNRKVGVRTKDFTLGTQEKRCELPLHSAGESRMKEKSSNLVYSGRRNADCDAIAVQYHDGVQIKVRERGG